MPSLTVSAGYPDAATGVLDGVIFQTFYRQLGIVAVNFGTRTVFQSAQWLAANGRGGVVRWVVPDRLFEWNGVAVAPGVPNSPTIDVWLYGSAEAQRNTVLTRKGFWSFYLFPAVTSARLAVTTGLTGRILGALGES